MTVQTLGIGKTAYPALASPPAAERALDRLDAQNLAKKLVVFTPSGEGVSALLATASQKIGGLATVETVQTVASFNHDNFWAIARKGRYNSKMQKV